MFSAPRLGAGRKIDTHSCPLIISAMELSIVKSLVGARPFKPFKLVLPSDREIVVPHPEFISISPTGVSAVVWHQDGGIDHVDMRLIVSAKEDGPNSN
jgi:hypothetical protein